MAFLDYDGLTHFKEKSDAAYEKKHGTYELIETITLTEDVANITRNQEPDGTAYNFTALGAVFQTAVASGKAHINAGFKGMITGVTDMLSSSGKRYGWLEFYQRDGVWFTTGTTAKEGFNWERVALNGVQSNVVFTKKVSEIPVITTVTFWSTTSSVPIPTGTIIQIYGVRA